MIDECEYCAQSTNEKRVVERPMEDEDKSLAPFFWVIDPARLVFCDEECRVKWHGLRRKAIWQSHGDSCMCVVCAGRS